MTHARGRRSGADIRESIQQIGSVGRVVLDLTPGPRPRARSGEVGGVRSRVGARLGCLERFIV
jgi:hypothetical protein